MWSVWIIRIWLLGISLTDIKCRKIPVWSLALGGGIAFFALLDQFYNGNLDFNNIIKGMLPGILLLVFAIATQKAGYGDGIVLLLLGMVAGGGKAWLLLGVSLFFVSAASVVLLVLRKAGRNMTIPYLPFLTVSGLLTGIY